MVEKILYLSLLLSGFSLPVLAFAAEPQIYGQVWVGSSGAPARGATVSVVCGSAATKTDTVDSSGRYRVTGLPVNKECQLTVLHEKQSLPLKVRIAGSDVRINLELTPWKGNKWLLHKR